MEMKEVPPFVILTKQTSKRIIRSQNVMLSEDDEGACISSARGNVIIKLSANEPSLSQLQG